MGRKVKKTSKNIDETGAITKEFLDLILEEGGEDGALVVGLSGNLGAGKTAFTKLAAKHLGVKNIVNSPTFVILKKYPIKSKNHTHLFHIDAYRLKNEKELLMLGWQEIISDKKNLVFVEWPENVEKIIPAGAKRITIQIAESGEREFQLE